MPLFAVFLAGGDEGVVHQANTGGIFSELCPEALNGETIYCTTAAKAEQLLLEIVAEQAARHGQDEYAPSYAVVRLPFVGAVVGGFVWSAVLLVEELTYCGVFSSEALALERLRNIFDLGWRRSLATTPWCSS